MGKEIYVVLNDTLTRVCYGQMLDLVLNFKNLKEEDALRLGRELNKDLAKRYKKA